MDVVFSQMQLGRPSQNLSRPRTLHPGWLGRLPGCRSMVASPRWWSLQFSRGYAELHPDQNAGSTGSMVAPLRWSPQLFDGRLSLPEGQPSCILVVTSSFLVVGSAFLVVGSVFRGYAEVHARFSASPTVVSVSPTVVSVSSTVVSAPPTIS